MGNCLIRIQVERLCRSHRFFNWLRLHVVLMGIQVLKLIFIEVAVETAHFLFAETHVY